MERSFLPTDRAPREAQDERGQQDDGKPFQTAQGEPGQDEGLAQVDGVTRKAERPRLDQLHGLAKGQHRRAGAMNDEDRADRSEQPEPPQRPAQRPQPGNFRQRGLGLLLQREQQDEMSEEPNRRIAGPTEQTKHGANMGGARSGAHASIAGRERMRSDDGCRRARATLNSHAGFAGLG